MEEKTYEELVKDFETLNNEYNTIQDDCARKGLPYNEMLEAAKDVLEKLSEISRQMRLKQEPTITYKRQKGGNKYPLQDFIDMCNDRVLTDYDGFGIYATEKGVSDIEIYPSDIEYNEYRKDFTHVIWYNK